MLRLLNTLYIMQPEAYVRLDGQTLCVEIDGKSKTRIPIHHLRAVYCMGDIMLTPAVIRTCAQENISVVFFDRVGRFRARVEGPQSGNVLLRIDHHKCLNDAAFRQDLLQILVAGKIFNSRQVLMRAGRDAKQDADVKQLNETSESLAKLLRRIGQLSLDNELRGLEGLAAKEYFEAINFAVRPDCRESFSIAMRTRRPPLDRMNALLSFLYAVLLNDCHSAVEGVGLDPQMGFLHVPRPGRPGLALDLMEEFRSVLADRLALTLINREQITATDFEQRPGGAVYLSEEGRKTVLAAYQKRKQEEITHHYVDQKMPLGLVPAVQARLLARVIRRDMPFYVPFRWR